MIDTLSLIAGTSDGGTATSTRLYYPAGVALDSSGNVYIADIYNNRIRKVSASDGKISTIAGRVVLGIQVMEELLHQLNCIILKWPHSSYLYRYGE